MMIMQLLVVTSRGRRPMNVRFSVISYSAIPVNRLLSRSMARDASVVDSVWFISFLMPCLRRRMSALISASSVKEVILIKNSGLVITLLTGWFKNRITEFDSDGVVLEVGEFASVIDEVI